MGTAWALHCIDTALLTVCFAWAQAPSVPETTFSNELAEFVSLCVNKNDIKRPSANDLLKHHWLRKHPTDDMLLSASLEKMML